MLRLLMTMMRFNEFIGYNAPKQSHRNAMIAFSTNIDLRWERKTIHKSPKSRRSLVHKHFVHVIVCSFSFYFISFTVKSNNQAKQKLLIAPYGYTWLTYLPATITSKQRQKSSFSNRRRRWLRSYRYEMRSNCVVILLHAHALYAIHMHGRKSFLNVSQKKLNGD